MSIRKIIYIQDQLSRMLSDWKYSSNTSKEISLVSLGKSLDELEQELYVEYKRKQQEAREPNDIFKDE